MTDVSNGKRDFFISFNQADRAWATWIAWVLEEAKYSVWFQDWDFRRNFVEHMDEAHRKSAWTIAVLSDNYFGSKFARLELSARIAKDPEQLIPIRVGSLSEDHIIDAMLYADLTGCDEAEAEQRLLGHIREWIDLAHRPKPETRPGFPGAPVRQVLQKPRFPVASHNLPPANPDFVGREDALTRLYATLSKSGTAVITQAHAITGLGGVGKSQVALAYCYRHLADYRLIWWLRAEEPVTLAADYASLAAPLGLPELPEQAKQIQAVKAKLQASRSWLLIFDNAEDPAVLRSYLPGTGGQVLITSRRADWLDIAFALLLDVMPETEAVVLLLGGPAADPAQHEAATTLAKELGYLPLALAQAHAFMSVRKVDIAGYQRQLAVARLKVLAWRRPEAAYPLSVAQTWQASMTAAAEDCPAARPLLELLAFFAPEAIPRDLLGAALEVLPESLHDPFDRDSAIEALHRFSLLRADPITLSVHRLVQAVTRDGLDMATAKARAEAAVRLVNAALPDEPQDPTNWPAIGALLPHALAVAETVEPLIERALTITETALGPDHPNTAASLNNLALLYQDQGRLAEAAPLFQRALTITETALGADHPVTASSLNNLASLYRDQGRLNEAEPLLERALAIREKVLGPDHPDTATGLNNLALLYRDQGRLAEAEPLYQRALAILETALGADHPDTAASLNNLAGLYRAQGRLDEAAPLFQRALAIFEKAFGPDHSSTRTVRKNLAELWQSLSPLPPNWQLPTISPPGTAP